MWPSECANVRDFAVKAQMKHAEEGRSVEEQVHSVMSSLVRRRHANAMIIGGTVESRQAVIQSLAHRIATNQVPKSLQCKLFALDIQQITHSCDDLDKRLMCILVEMEDSGGDAVLYIDQLSAFMCEPGAVSILRSLLARGVIRCIGGTSCQDYQDYIQHDPVLSKYFQQIFIDPIIRQDDVFGRTVFHSARQPMITNFAQNSMPSTSSTSLPCASPVHISATTPMGVSRKRSGAWDLIDDNDIEEVQERLRRVRHRDDEEDEHFLREEESFRKKVRLNAEFGGMNDCEDDSMCE